MELYFYSLSTFMACTVTTLVLTDKSSNTISQDSTFSNTLNDSGFHYRRKTFVSSYMPLSGSVCLLTSC